MCIRDRRKAYLIIFLLALFTVWDLSAQNSRWSDHFSYRNASSVAESESYVAAACEMGLMLFNKLTKEISKYSRVNGLSDVDVTAIQSLTNDRFIVGYGNGNIDILSEKGIINIPDFKLKQIQGTKRINHFFVHKDVVYCSTDYALLVVSPSKNEVSDTYFLGVNAESLVINETLVIDSDIFAATNRGLLKANLYDPLIVYDKAWKLVSTNAMPCMAVNLHEGEVVSVVKEQALFKLMRGSEGGWTTFLTASNFKSLDAFGGKLVVSLFSKIVSYNANYVQDFVKEGYSFETGLMVQDALYSSFEDAYFFADKEYGIVKSDGGVDISYTPNGPYSNNCFHLHATSQGVYSSAGGITSMYNNLGRHVEFSVFNNTWTHFWSDKKGAERDWRDLLRICSDKEDDSKVFMSSWGGGAFEICEVDSVIHHGKSPSGLQNIDWAGTSYIRVGGIASDSDGNIWMSNSEVDAGIVVKSDSSWYRFDYATTNDLHSTGQILITRDDYVWIPIPMSWLGDRQGIMVINTNGTLLDDKDDEYKSGVPIGYGGDKRNKGVLRLWDENRNEITRVVLSMAEDKNGYVWLGTDKGVLVYYRPWAIFSEDYPVASKIKVPRNDGSNLADYLLEKERISCIAVDGANRKWIGTENSGIYLVSEDGLKTYQTFNVENSPLPSNSITSMAISPVSGEVFIGTAKGIVSYKAKATAGQSDFNRIYAYPNPVREDFNGDITITGLMENSTVKITTVSGKLVCQTKSLGGNAYWNGRNINGEKVKTGVYLVYVSGEEGQQSNVTKILIVR
jgi:hypothetical protein